MKRGSHGDAFLKLLERIRATIPGVSLRTSFIVGFPGETESDFAELCDFVRAAKLDWMGVFEYSDVDNAASFPLADKVDAATITDRRNQLMAIQKKISRENLRAKKGTTAIALVEGPSKDNPLVWEARLEGMAPGNRRQSLFDGHRSGRPGSRDRRRGPRRNHQDRQLRFDRASRGNSAAQRCTGDFVIDYPASTRIPLNSSREFLPELRYEYWDSRQPTRNKTPSAVATRRPPQII